MKNLLTVLLCLLSINPVYAELQQGNSPDKNYLDYYHSVALAEEAVVNGNYRNAIERYKTVFEEYLYNNPVDCYVAAQVASYIKDTASCISFIYKGVCFGLPTQTIISNPHLTDIFRSLEQHSVDSCRGIYLENIDAEARAAMLSLVKRDQSIVHGLPPGERLYMPDGYRLKDIYRPVWDSLLREVITLTHNRGFPAQKIIGTQTGEDSLLRIGPNSVFVMYIFIHHGNGWSEVSEILWSELLKGNITPQMYGVIYETSNGRPLYNNPINYFASRPCDGKQCKSMVKDGIRDINKARWEIGLGSYEVMQKKFESMSHYIKWCRKGANVKQAYFDFQCELSFQGI